MGTEKWGVQKACGAGPQAGFREQSTEELDGPWGLQVLSAEEEGLQALPSPEPTGVLSQSHIVGFADSLSWGLHLLSATPQHLLETPDYHFGLCTPPLPDTGPSPPWAGMALASYTSRQGAHLNRTSVLSMQ